MIEPGLTIDVLTAMQIPFSCRIYYDLATGQRILGDPILVSSVLSFIDTRPCGIILLNDPFESTTPVWERKLWYFKDLLFSAWNGNYGGFTKLALLQLYCCNNPTPNFT